MVFRSFGIPKTLRQKLPVYERRELQRPPLRSAGCVRDLPAQAREHAVPVTGAAVHPGQVRALQVPDEVVRPVDLVLLFSDGHLCTAASRE